MPFSQRANMIEDPMNKTFLGNPDALRRQQTEKQVKIKQVLRGMAGMACQTANGN